MPYRAIGHWDIRNNATAPTADREMLMASNATDYKPISCDFHDVLEAAAMSHKTVHVRFLDEEGSLQHRSATLVDVFSRSGAEYLSISTGETVRLDRLIEVDRSKLADF